MVQIEKKVAQIKYQWDKFSRLKDNDDDSLKLIARDNRTSSFDFRLPQNILRLNSELYIRDLEANNKSELSRFYTRDHIFPRTQYMFSLLKSMRDSDIDILNFYLLWINGCYTINLRNDENKKVTNFSYKNNYCDYILSYKKCNIRIMDSITKKVIPTKNIYKYLPCINTNGRNAINFDIVSDDSILVKIYNGLKSYKR